jgi:drug/metabolite transporter (DMT)-like permease
MNRRSSLIALHAIVLIWGFTGILGKEISLNAVPLVFWRTLIAFLGVLGFVWIFKKKVQLSYQQVIKLALVGLLIAGHWIAFFTSIKLSNISTALTVLSTNAIFTAIVAPWIVGGKTSPRELLMGGVGTIGLAIIFHFEGQFALGILWSLLAALLAAVFSSFNARWVREMEPVSMTLMELLFANFWVMLFILLSPQEDFQVHLLDWRNIALLLILGWLATSIPFIVSIEVMKKISPFTCAIAINMEPIYSILIALYLYGSSEWMSSGFYWGAFLILAVVFIETFWRKEPKG